MEVQEFFELQFEKFRLRVPKAYWYAAYDTWAKVEGEEARVGVTDFFQTKLGDIAFVAPLDEEEFEQDDVFCSLESIKATVDLTIPVSGVVIEFNPELETQPELVSEDPYGAGWIARLRLTDWEEDREMLLTPEEYLQNMIEKVHKELNQ